MNKTLLNGTLGSGTRLGKLILCIMKFESDVKVLTKPLLEQIKGQF